MTLRNILAGTAVAALFAVGAQAQQATDPAAPAPAVPGAAAPLDPAAPADPLVPGGADPAPLAPGVTGEMHEGYVPVDLAAVSTERLTGANIVNHQNETIASVDDVLITDAGQVDGVVAKFGGFLGFGSNLVMIGMDEVEVMEDANGTLILRTALTPEQIETRPEYVAPAN